MTYIYKKDTYRNDLDWLYFNHQPRTQGNKQVQDKQDYIPVSFIYPTYSSRHWVHQPRHDNNIQYKVATWHGCSRQGQMIGRFMEIKHKLKRKKFHKTNQCSNFQRGSFTRFNSIQKRIIHPHSYHQYHRYQNGQMKQAEFSWQCNLQALDSPLAKRMCFIFFQ